MARWRRREEDRVMQAERTASAKAQRQERMSDIEAESSSGWLEHRGVRDGGRARSRRVLQTGLRSLGAIVSDKGFGQGSDIVRFTI